MEGVDIMNRKYTYRCDVCGKVEIIELPFGSVLPEEYKCLHCEDGIMKHDFIADMKSQVTHIPNNFRAVKKF